MNLLCTLDNVFTELFTAVASDKTSLYITSQIHYITANATTETSDAM